MAERPFTITTSYITDPGLKVRSVEELLEILRGYRDGDPELLFLRSADGKLLMIGVGGPYGVAFCNPTPDPPYYSALGEIQDEGAYYEIDVSSAPTPIPMSRCLSHARTEEIAEYFFETGERHPGVEWMED